MDDRDLHREAEFFRRVESRMVALEMDMERVSRTVAENQAVVEEYRKLLPGLRGVVADRDYNIRRHQEQDREDARNRRRTQVAVLLVGLLFAVPTFLAGLVADLHLL